MSEPIREIPAEEIRPAPARPAPGQDPTPGCSDPASGPNPDLAGLDSEPIPAEEIHPAPLPADSKSNSSPAPKPPMHWHGFLVKGMLFLAAAWHIFQAVWIATGKIYYTPAVRDQVYAGIPALRIIDYALAAGLLISAALLLLARGDLAKRRWTGVKRLLGAYILLAACPAAYALARLIAAGLSPFSIPVLGQMAAYIALLLVNRSYYAKRRSAFDGKEKNESGK